MPVLTHFLKWRFGLAGPEVWTTAAERACLARHAAGRRRLVEVGVWHGGTTRCLRAAMAADAVLFAVDPFPAGRLGVSLPRVVARGEVARVGNGRVEWVRATGEAAAAMTVISETGVDFVFIDNAQTRETLRAEWEAWSPLVVPGGVIALHDTRPDPAIVPDQSSVGYARERILTDPRFTVVDEVDTLTVLRRTG
jgi:predicted O-methyltransferase YrrM